MNATLRRRFEMAVRVRDFLKAHPADGAPEQAALAQLEELIQRADTLAARQRAGVMTSRASTAHRHELRRAVHTKLLKYLGAVGAVAGRGNVELGVQFRLPLTRASNQAFLTMAHGMLDKATAQKDLLLSRGMSATLLDDLAAAITEYEQTLESTRTGRRDHIGASGDLRAVASEITEQVKLLDGLVNYRFGADAELMTAWASMKNVLGPFKPHAEPQGSAGGTAAPQSGGSQTPASVAPAA